MNRRRLVWKVAPVYLSVTLLAVAALGWLSVHDMRGFFLRQTREDLELRARLVADELPETFPHIGADTLLKLCIEKGRAMRSRITIVALDGRVLGDSDADPRYMENHSDHPEVQAALAGQLSFDLRYSATVHQNMMYLAMPVRRGNVMAGVVRTSMPLTVFEYTLHSLLWRIILGAILVAALSTIVTLILSRRLSRPIVELVRGAERYARGEFAEKLPVPDTRELASLAETLNRMAAELDAKIRELTAQRNEQEAILGSMREGVIAVNMQERILFLNRMVGDLFTVDITRAKNRLLQECIRSSDLQRYLGEMLEGGEEPAPREIAFSAQDNRILQISGSFLRDADNKLLGALIVLNDMTQLRQLEGLRREFVANVSHELKTPVTTIKGFIETLREGAINDAEHAPEFLERIAQNADRLNSLLDDLLSLSRIEQETDRAEIALLPESVPDIVKSAIEAISAKAKEKRILIRFNADEEIRAMANPSLLEQAVLNLLDNAVKYSEAGKLVEIRVERDGKNAAVRVKDYGCGIAAEHLPRLFERFYRVDKARSRKQGGTGLGLAIVKHIAKAHDGEVAVESRINEGSTFSILIPAII
ncbi:HAMP domain-containing protein [candidate division KSB1 bacterium]|nr:MAG: HAMP domain-containing protein [candidate division KSB1 bacterium]